MLFKLPIRISRWRRSTNLHISFLFHRLSKQFRVGGQQSSMDAKRDSTWHFRDVVKKRDFYVEFPIQFSSRFLRFCMFASSSIHLESDFLLSDYGIDVGNLKINSHVQQVWVYSFYSITRARCEVDVGMDNSCF